jgi:hypothetical protein
VGEEARAIYKIKNLVKCEKLIGNSTKLFEISSTKFTSKMFIVHLLKGSLNTLANFSADRAVFQYEQPPPGPHPLIKKLNIFSL